MENLSHESSEKEKSIENFLFENLGIKTNQLSPEKKALAQKNFNYFICLVMTDLSIIRNRLKAYKMERASLDKVKSNAAEYRRRKLEYFARLNKDAQDEILDFLNNGFAEYLLDFDYDVLERDTGNDELGTMYRNRRYKFALFPEYFDADFDFSTVVKVSQIPGIDLLDLLKVEKQYLDLRKNEPEKYNQEIAKVIQSNDLMETILSYVKNNYHLYKRHEIFEDLARLYKERHFQSFLALGLLQLEGLFFDICSIKNDDKENAGTLVEKAEKALGKKNEFYFMRMFPYFAFDVPVKRNEIAHTGMISNDNLERVANDLVLDLNAVARIAKLESDGNFRICFMIYDELQTVDPSDVNAINKKLIFELYADRTLVSSSFWEVLKNPSGFTDEINFYKIDNLPADQVDLPVIVQFISDMLRNASFWDELNTVQQNYKEEREFNDFMMMLAQKFVYVLEPTACEKCKALMAKINQAHNCQ